MIGRIKNVTKFGIFVEIPETKNVGLLRWTNFKGKRAKFERGDLVAVEILSENEEGKIELKTADTTALQMFSEFLTSEEEKLEELRQKNKEVLGY